MDVDNYDIDIENSLNNNQSNMNYSSNINLGSNSLNNNGSITQNHSLFHFNQSALNQNNPNLNNPMKFNKMPFSDYRHEKNILYMSDLPYNTNETDIKLFFKIYGDLCLQ